MRLILNQWKRMLICLVCSFPWLLMLPYMINSWRNTPLDHQNWIFVLVFLVLVVGRLFLRKLVISDDGADIITLAAFIVSVGILALAWAFSVHFLGIVGGICLFWSGIRLALGRTNAKQLSFACIILFLATPSTNYLLGSLCGIESGDALLAKYILTVICFGLACIRIPVHLELTAFIIGLVAAFILYHELTHITRRYAVLKPNFGALSMTHRYMGRVIEPDEGMRRFFRHSDVKNYHFADNQRNYGVLEVHCGKNIHEIHPASHCLRCGGATILVEHQRIINLRGCNYAVQEIIVEKNGHRELVYVWYSTDEFSVASFLSFRKFWSSSVSWYSWQVQTVLSDTPEDDKEQLRQFIEAFLPRPNVKEGIEPLPVK